MANLFASIDYDGVIKLWDMRTLAVPLHTMKDAHSGKGLCLAWSVSKHTEESAHIWTGGSDCCLKSISISDIHSSGAADGTNMVSDSDANREAMDV